MDWRHRAACRDEDPELFFPIGTSGPALLQVEQAKAVCRRCTVADDCLQWALETGQDAGVWGGMSEESGELSSAAAGCACAPTRSKRHELPATQGKSRHGGHPRETPRADAGAFFVARPLVTFEFLTSVHLCDAGDNQLYEVLSGPERFGHTECTTVAG
jgi:WhiB family redox-sensing transcriptional regulator